MIPRTEGHLETGDGELIWYETAGRGPALVFAHGLGGNAAVWYQQLPHFAEDYQVITWDQRGFGRSSANSGNLGPLPALKDQLMVLDHLQVDRAHLVGQSMGGWVVLGAALEAPERVISLVLASTTAGIPPREVPGLDPSEVREPEGVRPLGIHPAIGERLPTADLARAYLYQALGTFGDRPSDGHFARLLSETTYDASRLSGLQTPTLMVSGSEDPVMTPERVRDAATRLNEVTVIEMPELGHSPYFEAPEEWNVVVGDFLRGIRQA